MVVGGRAEIALDRRVKFRLAGERGKFGEFHVFSARFVHDFYDDSKLFKALLIPRF